MSRRAVLLILVGATLSACALMRRNGDELQPAPLSEAANVVRRVAQLGFGRQANFAECVEPACPTKTSKSLPVVPESTPAQATTPRPSTAPPTAQGTLQPAASATAPAPAPEGRRLILQFALNSASLTASHKVLLRNALGELRRTERIVIAGRTDDLGSESFNRELALARALAIRDHILDLAIDLPARITIDAKGRCCYAATNDSLAGRAQNRRVEVAYTPRAEEVP